MPMDNPIQFLWEGGGQTEATKEPDDAEVGIHGFAHPFTLILACWRMFRQEYKWKWVNFVREESKWFEIWD